MTMEISKDWTENIVTLVFNQGDRQIVQTVIGTYDEIGESVADAVRNSIRFGDTRSLEILITHPGNVVRLHKEK